MTPQKSTKKRGQGLPPKGKPAKLFAMPKKSALRSPGGKPFASHLRPFAGEILTQRETKTWQEIADYLKATHGIKTTRSCLYEFVKRYLIRPEPVGRTPKFSPPSPPVERPSTLFQFSSPPPTDGDDLTQPLQKPNPWGN